MFYVATGVAVSPFKVGVGPIVVGFEEGVVLGVVVVVGGEGALSG